MNGKNGTTQQIYQAALRVLEAEGPQEVGIRRVAREIGVTPMAIYRHFPNREALLQQVVDTEFEKLVDFFGQSIDQRGFEEQVIHILDGYMDYALTHPRIFDYVFSSPRPGAQRFPNDFRSRRSPTLNLVADAVELWIKRKRLRRGDVWEIAMDLWAHVHGYVMLFRAGRFHLSEKDFRKLVHRSLRRLLHGLIA